MQKYYFADSCLQVFDDNNFFHANRLSNFQNEISYNNEIILNTSFDNCTSKEEVINVSTGSGVNIGVDGNRWIFSGTDITNPCCIEANCDCSKLHCYINLSESSDKNALSENTLQLLRTAIECNLAHHDGVSIHASCITHNKKAILFTAPSGIGKSTQADIWKNSMGAKIISGDRPFLHLFADEVRAYGVPWDGKEQIFLQEDYPVSAIIEVRRASENSIRKLSETQAFRLMMKQCFIPMWDDTAKFSVMETISLISKKVPFYRLFCLPQKSAAELLNEVLFINQNISLKEEKPDMRLKEGFILKNIVGEWIIMPTGNNIKKFEGAIVLNDIAAFIWNKLEKPISRDDLLQAVLDEYDIDEQTAADDLDKVIIKLNSLEILQQA